MSARLGAATRSAIACAALVCASTKPGLAPAGEFGINVYGAAYHLDRERAKQLRVDNELNPGLGLRYRDVLVPQWDWFGDIGAYRDSGRNTAAYAAAGALWKTTWGLRAGGALAVMHSDTYNRGRTFVAPLPVLAYEWQRVTLNMTYFPRVADFNEVAALGFWLTFPLR
jgi:hypothetical protein